MKILLTNVKSRDHCHITGKYKSSTHRDCNINVELNQKFLFYNLKNYGSHLIMKEPGKLKN